MKKILFIIYDNGSHLNWFPLNIAYLIQYLNNYYSGELIIEIFNEDINHDIERLETKLIMGQYDYVCLGTVAGYYQFVKLKQISEIINKARNGYNLDFKYIVGGHGVCVESEYFIKQFGIDIIVRGEGEQTLLEIIEDKKYYENIKGISFKYFGTDKVIHTEERELLDIGKINFGLDWKTFCLFPLNIYRLKRFANSKNTDFLMPLITSRGCTHNCNFCLRMDKGYRKRNFYDLDMEICYLNTAHRINYFYFWDELLMSSKNRAIEISEFLIDLQIQLKTDFKWACMGRLNYATPEVLKLMKRAGCVFINYGIEQFDDKALEMMNKKLTCKQIEEGVKNTIEAGISPGLNMIWGNIGDTVESLEKSVDFLIKYDDGSQLRTIRPVTPYPGTELYNIAIEKGLLKGIEDFYNKHSNSDLLTVNFTDLSDSGFYRNLYKANGRLMNNYYKNHMRKRNDELLDNLYFKKDSKFRGFRDV